MADTDTTHRLECPSCGAEFTATKTQEQMQDADELTACPECGEEFPSAIDEDTNALFLYDPNAEEDDEEDDRYGQDDEDGDAFDEDEEEE